MLSSPSPPEGAGPAAASPLLRAAARLVAKDGFAGLTLRPLAAELGLSVSSLTSRYGSREDIIARVLAEAAAEDRHNLGAWAQMRDRIPTGQGLAIADVAEMMLDHAAADRRDLSVLFLECVQAGGWDSQVRSALSEWRDVRADAWNGLARHAGLPEVVVRSGLIEGYFIDEFAYSVALADIPAYRALRRLCLRRLFANLLPDRDPRLDDGALGDVLYELLAEDVTAPGVVHGVALPQDWRLDAAKCCAIQLTQQGVSAVTHRSVAALAGLRPTTLAYRYPTQEDLVIAGLEYIITRLLTSVADVEASGSGDLVPADPMEGLDVGRATFAVAVAAIRIPRLAPCAADMRRRRGINLLRLLQSRSQDYARMDRLSAQTLAVGVIGSALLIPISESSGPANESRIEASRRWMLDAAQPV